MCSSDLYFADGGLAQRLADEESAQRLAEDEDGEALAWRFVLTAGDAALAWTTADESLARRLADEDEVAARTAADETLARRLADEDLACRLAGEGAVHRQVDEEAFGAVRQRELPLAVETDGERFLIDGRPFRSIECGSAATDAGVSHSNLCGFLSLARQLPAGGADPGAAAVRLKAELAAGADSVAQSLGTPDGFGRPDRQMENEAIVAFVLRYGRPVRVFHTTQRRLIEYSQAGAAGQPVWLGCTGAHFFALEPEI